MDKNDEMKYAEMFSRWYSWGSPIGLSVLLISLALTFFISANAIKQLTEVGKTGVEIGQQLNDGK